MRTLITGGFGFVGTHLVEELATQRPDDHLHVVDNLSTSIVDHEEFAGRFGNLSYDVTDVGEFLEETDEQFERIYHLASIVGPAGILPRAGRIAGSIIHDADVVAEKTKEWNARLLNVSTSELYGGGTSSEDDDKIITAKTSARLEYATGKLAAEIALANLAKTEGLDVVTVRPFNIAGARQSKIGGFVLPRFAHQALTGEPLTVFGDGSQIRAFTHAPDMATGLRFAMERGVRGEVYNVGDPSNRTTIREVACRVIALANSNSRLSFVDPKTIYGEHYEEANDKLPDSSKARAELGWRPASTLNDIINDALAWERTLL